MASKLLQVGRYGHQSAAGFTYVTAAMSRMIATFPDLPKLRSGLWSKVSQNDSTKFGADWWSS